MSNLYVGLQFKCENDIDLYKEGVESYHPSIQSNIGDTWRSCNQAVMSM